MTHTVQLENTFSGPMDLLLYLVRRDEIDIHDIPVAHLTREYLAEIERMDLVDVDAGGEFVAMASMLTEIKSRMLLPAVESEEGEDEDDHFDPRQGLVQALLEYKRFKEAAAELEEMALLHVNRFGRLAPPPPFAARLEVEAQELGALDLFAAFQKLARKMLAGSAPREIINEEIPTEVRIAQIEQVLEVRERVEFSSLLSDHPSKDEMVGFFIALLELIRLKKIRAQQSVDFSEIYFFRFDAAQIPEDLGKSEQIATLPTKNPVQHGILKLSALFPSLRCKPRRFWGKCGSVELCFLPLRRPTGARRCGGAAGVKGFLSVPPRGVSFRPNCRMRRKLEASGDILPRLPNCEGIKYQVEPATGAARNNPQVSGCIPSARSGCPTLRSSSLHLASVFPVVNGGARKRQRLKRFHSLGFLPLLSCRAKPRKLRPDKVGFLALRLSSGANALLPLGSFSQRLKQKNAVAGQAQELPESLQKANSATVPPQSETVMKTYNIFSDKQVVGYFPPRVVGKTSKGLPPSPGKITPADFSFLGLKSMPAGLKRKLPQRKFLQGL